MFGLFRKKNTDKTANDKVRAGLAARGDDGLRPRRVMHFVSPAAGGATNGTVVKEFLLMNGLEVDTATSGEGFVAEEQREFASADFDARTAMLAHAMGEWNWKYDGWTAQSRPSEEWDR